MIAMLESGFSDYPSFFRIFSPRDLNGSIILGRLNTDSTKYPTTPTAITLLIVMLTIMPAQAGKTLNVSGGGKNSQR